MRQTAKILILLFLVMSGSALAQFSRKTMPEKLGYRPIELTGEQRVQLMVAKIVDGIERGDLHAFAGLLADAYREVPAAGGETTGYILARNGSKQQRNSVLNGRAAFLQKAAEPGQSADEPLRYTVRDLLSQGDAIDCTLEAWTENGEVRGSVRLFFSRTTQGWQLTMSDGLSLLAAQRPALMQAKQKKDLHELYRAATADGLVDSQTIKVAELAPEYQLTELNEQIAQKRLDRKLFAMPYGAALFAHTEVLDGAPFFKSSYVQIVSDPGWNRLVYGDYRKWIKSYDAAESGKALRRPLGVAVDMRGVVYVADAGNGRIVVLKLTGPADDLNLLYLGTLGDATLSQPAEVAWDDRGTLDDAGDDLIWVLDRGSNRLFAFSANMASKRLVADYSHAEVSAPTALAIGRFDGKSDGQIYLADQRTRTIRRLFFDGEIITETAVWQAENEWVPTALSTDHWGQLYVTDQATNEIVKLSPQLVPLAIYPAGDDRARPLRLQTLFGAMKTSPQAPLQWTGYDQAFLVEEWGAESGARRLEFGQHLALQSISASLALDQLQFNGRLTDPGHIAVEIVDERSGEQHDLGSGWQQAGDFEFIWNRQQARETMLVPGYYRARLIATSTYGQRNILEAERSFYIPLYHYEDCGNVDVESTHRLRGAANHAAGFLPEKSVVTDPQAVVFRYTNLNPAAKYEVMVSYFAVDAPVEQQLFANEKSLHAPMLIGQSTLRTAWMSIPSQVLSNGRLELKIARISGEGHANVAEIWLREADFDAHDTPAVAIGQKELPVDYVIEQNYPNPFNPATAIEFSIPASHRGNVSLRIFNMLGQLVRELENSDLQPGVYNKIWDGKDTFGQRVASGIYIYRLRAGNYSASKKMILMQ